VPLDPLADFRLDHKVAIVTGASAGLGARFARVLDAAGARVVVAARRADRWVVFSSAIYASIRARSTRTKPSNPKSWILPG